MSFSKQLETAVAQAVPIMASLVQGSNKTPSSDKENEWSNDLMAQIGQAVKRR